MYCMHTQREDTTRGVYATAVYYYDIALAVCTAYYVGSTTSTTSCSRTYVLELNTIQTHGEILQEMVES